MNALKKLLVSKILSNVLDKFTADHKVTVLGVLAAALLGSKIDFGKLLEADPTEISNAATAVIMALIGFYSNKGVNSDVKSFLKGEEPKRT